MNDRADTTIEITEADLAEVQGGNTQQDIIDFLERFYREQEGSLRRMTEPVVW